MIKGIGLASSAEITGLMAVSALFETHMVHGASEALKLMPTAIWTLPEIASVGQTEDQARSDGKEILTCKAYFSETAKWALRTRQEVEDSVAYHSDKAFVKIIFTPRSFLVLGIHILGPGASELIAFAYWCIGKTLHHVVRTGFTAVTMSTVFMIAANKGLVENNQSMQLARTHSERNMRRGCGSDETLNELATTILKEQ